MAYYKDLLVPRIAVETTFGSDYPPVAKLMGVSEFEIAPKMETELADVMDGRFAKSDLVLRTKEYGEASLTALATYEDMTFWMNGAFGGLESSNPSYTTDASSDITRVWAAPVTGYASDHPTPHTFNLQYSNAAGSSSDFGYRLQGAFVKDFTVTAETGAPTEIQVNFAGHVVSEPSTDAVEDDRAVVFIMGDHYTVYVDLSTDAVGTTPLANTAFKAEMNVVCGREPQFHLGEINPAGYRDGEWEGTLNLSLEASATTLAYLVSEISHTPVKKVVRLKATTGASAALRTYQVDFAGVLLESPTLFTDLDGVVTIELAFTGSYNATMGNWLKVTLQNQVKTTNPWSA